MSGPLTLPVKPPGRVPGALWRLIALAGLVAVLALGLAALSSRSDVGGLHGELAQDIARLLAVQRTDEVELLLRGPIERGVITDATISDDQGAVILRIGNPAPAGEGVLIRADGPLQYKTSQVGWLSIGAQQTGADSPLLALVLTALALGSLCLLVIRGARLMLERRLAHSMTALAGAIRALTAGTPRAGNALPADDALAPLDVALAAAGHALEQERDRLTAQLARLERLALSHDEAECEWQLDTGDIWYNARFASLLGYDENDGFSLQFNWATATHPDDAITVRRARERLITREIERSDDPIRLRARDGTYRWFRMRAVASHDGAGKAVCLSGTLEDVTRERMTLDSLRESEARLFHAVRGSFDGAWDWDIGAGRYYLSPRLSELLGLQQSLLPQTHEQLLERVHPDDLSRLEHAIDEHFLRRDSFDIEYRMRHEAGHYLWVRDRGLATRSDKGKVLRFSGSITDITERKRAEQATRTLAAEKQALLDDVPVAIVYVRNGRIADCNRRCEEIFSYRRDELIGETVGRLFHDERGLDALLRGAASSAPSPHAQESVLLRSDASALHAYISVRQLEHDVQAGGETIWIFSDDTARRRALDAARREENFSAALVRSMPGAFFLLDATGTLRRWNENLQVLTGLSATHLLGKATLELFPPESHPLLKRQARRALIHRDASFEADLLAADGEPLAHAFSLYRIDLDGQPHLLGTGLDIRAQKEAERSVVALNQRLETRVRERTAELLTAMRELESFSYSVSHDLAAPLRGIDGFSRMIEEDYAEKLDDRGRDYLQRIRAATQRMHRLIDDLLGLARITRNEMNRQSVDVSALVRDIAAEMTRSEPQRRAEFLIQPSMRVYADANLLRIAIDNLLRNAWKFTGRHETARIEVGSLQRDRELVYFVKDDGAGFDMRYASKLFGPFQRLHSVGDFTGSGIGLAIVHRIVHRHGGRIWAEAEVERGACFYFTLESVPTGNG